MINTKSHILVIIKISSVNDNPSVNLDVSTAYIGSIHQVKGLPISPKGSIADPDSEFISKLEVNCACHIQILYIMATDKDSPSL